MAKIVGALFLCMLATACGFQMGTMSTMRVMKASSISSRGSMWIGAPVLRSPTSNVANRRSAPLSNLNMGLFGLGWGELAVIGVIAALIFGPKNLAGLGKDLGKIAGSLKAEAQTFSSAMQESLEEAEKGMKEAETQVTKPATPKEAPSKPTKKIDLTDE
ncbi:hypothetical protein GUITHDRAFT_165510 [Guillardia theta CCMP2712]|uniref:Sec-independent protein translocase protein TatA n=2 Tax=Guillardia theta TaxID=55529 RepID=L1IN99_GUITC|nr:hypothetical protein GUITHDRAFT_165510 [Guillardia theta CCMP2712]EKX37265.1 hypothetical protein GUITHDRAFT_165510 [Guillardia theta CCMP2712]|eukprot:XP_005824245.1 hypothetical protein GUITHDRAFT_165510 [Guillardia theta CCMP2712]